MSRKSVEFLTRPGCHLCEDALPVVRRLARLVGVQVVEVNVESDPRMAVEWGLRIPVVRTAGGRVLAEGRVSELPLLIGLLRTRISGGG